MTHAAHFEQVIVDTKANVYFDGKVVSHTVRFADGSKKTLGLIFAGKFTFNTAAPERMEIIAGDCRVRIAGEKEWRPVNAGEHFDVPGRSAFEIEVTQGIAEYICSFVP